MSKLGLDKQLSLFKRTKKSLMRDIANTSKNFFQLDTFQRQGFKNTFTKSWKPLKKPRVGLILVKTGRMRRGIRTRFVTSNRASVISTAEYSSFHNQGTSKMPKRQFMGKSRTLDKQCEKIIDRFLSKKFR